MPVDFIGLIATQDGSESSPAAYRTGVEHADVTMTTAAS